MNAQLQFSTPVAASYEENQKKFLPFGTKVIVRFDFAAKTWVIVNERNEILWSAPSLILEGVKFLLKENEKGDKDAAIKPYGCSMTYGFSGKAEGVLIKGLPETPASPLEKWWAKFSGKKHSFGIGRDMTSCNSYGLASAKYLTLNKDGTAQVVEPVRNYDKEIDQIQHVTWSKRPQFNSETRKWE